MRIFDELIKQLSTAAAYNPDVQVAPACILWPDKDRQWEPVLSRLQQELPQLFVLGDYDPDNQKGPAIWLRCIIDKAIDGVSFEDGVTPILYLPGYSRHDLRAIEECPEEIKPLAELQYRGTIWSQVSSKDWTILAFLKTDQGGLGLDVSQDSDAKNAMQLALAILLDEDIELLKGKRLDADYFNKLLMGGDPVKDLLLWIDGDSAFRDSRDETAWNAFVQVCKSQMAFDPASDGVLAAAEKLAQQEGPWSAVWDRFIEAPHRYKNIPATIRKCNPPIADLFSDANSMSGWPQWNEEQENSLREDLRALSSKPPHVAGKKIIELEKSHRERRSLVWAELGEAHLAEAMKYLARMVENTKNELAAGTIDELVRGYEESGWMVDSAVIKALNCAETTEEFDAVATAINSVYPSWLEKSARYLQLKVNDDGYPGVTAQNHKAFDAKEGDCVLFVDGLRFDAGMRVQELLEKKGYTPKLTGNWSALPSVTATGKPAVSPVRTLVTGGDSNSDFEAEVAETGKSLKGGHHFKSLLEANGWQKLSKSEVGNGTGRAWCEVGDIDHEGHDRGWKLSKHISVILKEVVDKIDTLAKAGWSRIRVVTDHGWLLVPQGLPKVELAAALTDSKWGRCAAIKQGASTEVDQYPWYWNPSQHFALADGISCFRANVEYTHGGLSLQECYTPELLIEVEGAASSSASVEITDVIWRGLRCKIAVDGKYEGLNADIRISAGDSSSSSVLSVKKLDQNGMASLVVEDEDLEGKEAFVVILDKTGSLISQLPTVIGE